MTTYILNSPILTGFGEWCYSGPISIDQAKRLLDKGFVSAIGHQGTAELLSALRLAWAGNPLRPQGGRTAPWRQGAGFPASGTSAGRIGPGREVTD